MTGNSRDIFVHKPQREGVTSLNPQSPINEIAKSPSPSTAGTIMLGYGSMLAKRTYATVTSEIALNGNERLAMQLENVGELGSRLALIIATKGLAAIPMAIEGISTTVTTITGRRRENRQRVIELSEKGVRIGYGSGSAYYD